MVLKKHVKQVNSQRDSLYLQKSHEIFRGIFLVSQEITRAKRLFFLCNNNNHYIKLSLNFSCRMEVGIGDNKQIVNFNQAVNVNLNIGGSGSATQKDLAVMINSKAGSEGARDIELINCTITSVTGSVELPK